MNKRIQTLLRWVAVLPGAIIAGVASTFVLHFILYSTLTNFVTPYPEFPERALTPLVVALVFIFSGAQIAPNNKLKVGVVLFAIWIFLAGGFIMMTMSGGIWFGKSLYFEAKGISAVTGIVGAFVGLFLVRNKTKEKQSDSLIEGLSESHSTNDIEQNSQSFSSKYKDEISDIIFIGLFLLCIFNETSRKVIFSLLLLFGLFLIFFTLKQKLYTTTTQKINFVKDILMAVALIIGLLSMTAGFYVSIICLALCTVTFGRRLVMQPIRDKK